MPARVRDAIVVAVLIVTAASAALAWHPLGHWASLVIAFAGLLVAAGVYRARRPASMLRMLRDATDERTEESASTRRPV